VPSRIAFGLTAFLLSFGAASAATPPLSGPQTPTAGDTAKPAPPPPRPVPVPEIPDRVLSDRGRLAEIRTAFPADSVLAQFDSALAVLHGHLQAEDRNVIGARLAGLSEGDLADLEGRWQRYRRSVLQWQDRLRARAQGQDSAGVELQQMRQLWRLTQDSVRAESLPPDLRRRVAEHVAAIDSVSAASQGVRNAVLRLQGRAADAATIVESALASIDVASTAARQRLFEADQPPLWAAIGRPARPSPALTASQKLTELAEYAAQHAGRFWLQGILVVVVAFVLTRLRRRSVRWDTAEHAVRTSADLLAHPVAVALLVGLVLTRAFHPLAPRPLPGFAWLLSVPPLLVVLPGVIPDALRRSAQAALALFVLFVLSFAFLPATTVRRFALLAMAGLGVAAFWHLERAARRERRPRPSRAWAAAAALSRLATLAAAGAVLAEVLGLSALARLLLDAVLRATVIGLLLVALVRVADGLLAVTLYRTALGSLHSVHGNLADIRRRAALVIRLLAVLWWLAVVLQVLSLRDPLLAVAGAVLGREWSVGSWKISLGQIVLFVAVIWLSVLLARAVRALLREDVLGRLPLARGVPDAISSVSYYALIAGGTLFAIGAAGVDLSRLTIVIGALGVGIGFGLQNIVNNFISGLILLIERPIQVGDVLEVQDLMGTVTTIGIRASRLRTFDGSEVIVPNGDLVSGRVVNWTLSDRIRRLEAKVGVVYGTQADRVLALLADVARRHPDVLDTPPPTPLFVGFGDSSLDFVLRFWTGIERVYEVQSEVMAGIQQALREAGIEVPFPQRDLHLRSAASDVGRALGLRPEV
jgi:potassium efflux system protein